MEKTGTMQNMCTKIIFCWKIKPYKCRIFGPPELNIKITYFPPEDDAVEFGRCAPTFRKKVLRPSSGYRMTRTKLQDKSQKT